MTKEHEKELRDGYKLAVKMLAIVRELEHRSSDTSYEDCDRVAADLMKKVFEEESECSDNQLATDALKMELLVLQS